MASRLPQATAEQIIVEALDYYSTNPLSGDALRQGMSLALRRLDAYLYFVAGKFVSPAFCEFD